MLRAVYFIIFVSCAYGQLMRDDGPSEQFQKSAAFYGLQVQRTGQLRTFDAIWNQLIVIQLPRASDYQQITEELHTYCLMMDAESYLPLDIHTNMTINQKVDEIRKTTGALQKSCRSFERTMKTKLTSMLNSAFKESLPNPSITRDSTVDLLTGNLDRNYEFSAQDIHELLRNKRPNGLLSDTMDSPINMQTASSIDEATTQFLSQTESILSSLTPVTTGAVTSSAETTTDIPQNDISDTNTRVEKVITNSNSFDDLLGKEVSRHRRFIISGLVIACVSLLSVSVGAYGMSLKNTEKIKQLETNVHRLVNLEISQDQENKILRDELISLTNMNEHRFNFSGNTLKSLLQIQKTNRAHIYESWSLLKNLSHADAVSNTVMLHLAEQIELTQKVTGILDSVRRRIRDFEVAMVSLLNQQMSTYLVSYSKMRSILFKIKETLPKSYQLAIPMTDLHLYYYFKLSSFVRVEDKLVLRLVVPLSVNRGFVTPDILFTPIYNSFPIPKQWDSKGTQGFVRMFSHSNDLWLFSQGRFRSQVSVKHLSCHDVGEYKDCIRFLPSSETPPSRCQALIWNEDFNPEHLFPSSSSAPCSTYTVDRETYNPIRISETTYILHGSSFLRYTMECIGEKPVILDIGEETAMTTVEVGEGCILRQGEKTYPGSVVSKYFNASISFFQQPPVLTLPTNATRRRLYSVSPVPHAEVNLTNVKYEPVQDFNRPVQDIVRRLKRQAQSIEERIEEVNVTLASSFHPTSSLGLLKSIQKFTFDILVICLALVSLRRANWITFSAPTVILLADTASATFVDSAIATFITDSVTVQYYDNIFSIILLVVLGYFILSLCLKNVFNRVYISGHRGTLRTISTRFLVQISFDLRCDCLCHTNMETFTLLYPLRIKAEKLAEKGIVQFYVLNEHMSWVVKNGIFQLSERVLFKGIDRNGDIVCELSDTVAFSLDSLTWRSARANSIKKAVWGNCTVKAFRNPKQAIDDQTM